ncbi:alpha-1A adrenergic receptor isoform X1 [Perognathus longimembris pacificus]|uniref:alpha-1A adrenergic receptor isoform X1 n=1 Tax=Perognathus longimembris pacificus TaxID=214514 RepID=UPI0020190154|nr:alpha-1A adrenergic receptor isoform X1 [Perognathus longimembris pacificus]
MVFLSGNASEGSNCTHPPAPVNVSKAVLLGVILGGLIVFGVLGNILVILSVACHRHLHSVTHYYIVNLAVADLLLTSTVLPFSAIFEILGYWAFGRVFCNIWAAVDVLCCTASILGLCIISIDRYIGVSYPLRYPAIVTPRRGVRALLGVWALSLVISVGPLFGWRQPAPEDETICQINEEPGYVLFSALGSFYVPLAIILVMYCRVYVVAKREGRGLKCGLKTEKADSEQVTLRIHRRNAPSPGAGGGGSGGGGGASSAKNKTHFSVRLLKFSREKKAAKTLGIVVGCFVLCWLPFFLVMPIGSFFPEFKPSETVFKIVFWLGYLNSCINPIIYPCSSQEFKKAFQNVLRIQCLRRRQSSKHTLGYTLHAPSHAPEGQPKDMVRIPVGSGETFYKISKTDGVCEWKFSSLPHGSARITVPKDQSACTTARVRSKSFLQVCCCVGPSTPSLGEHHQVPTIKIHTISLSENGEEV